MRQFKFIFYPLYILLAVGMLYFSLDGLFNMDETRVWLDARIKIRNQIYYAMVVFFLMSSLMLIELLMDYFGMRALKKERHQNQEEITKLKARLYDYEPHPEPGGKESEGKQIDAGNSENPDDTDD